MLRELLERDGAWKSTGGLIFAAAVVYPFLCLLAPGSLVIWFGVCLPSAFNARRRATPFEAALPIPGRQLVAARLIATLAGLWLPALAIAAEALLLSGWKDALWLLEAVGVMSLVVLVQHSVRVRQTSSPKWLGYMLVGCASAFLLLAREFDLHLGAIVAVCLAASAALLAGLWFRVPAGFQIAPASPTSARRSRRLPSRERRWLPVWLPAWRAFFHGQFASPLVFGWLLVMMRMSLVLGAGMALRATVACRWLEWLLVLPVPRRKLLRMLVLPWVCMLATMIPLGRHVFGSGARDPAVSTGSSDVWLKQTEAGSGTPNVLVPTSIWHWTWPWEAPVIRSPWGETNRPRTFLRLGFSTYNPYSVAPENSPRFLDWQFARATEAVYGRAIPLSSAAALARMGLVPVTLRLRTRCVEVLAAMLVFLALLGLAFWHRTRSGRLWAVVTGAGLMAPFLLDILGTERVVRTGMLSEVITLRLAAILPQNPAALLVAAAVLLGGVYWAAQRQFEKVDLIPGLKPARDA